jgi:hypothetical protein
MHPYSSIEFAESLGHIGEPIYLPEWGTAVLIRDCGNGYRDAMGTYPITVFKPDTDFAAGLERLARAGVVSIVLVVDEALRPDLANLRQAFDFVQVFKTHFIHDRRVGSNGYSKNHAYKIRRAGRAVRVERFDLGARFDEWLALYQAVVTRHGLAGTMHDFPRRHHEALARLSGVAAIGGFSESRLVSCHIWVCNGGHAMSHLVASDDSGYATGAAYAVNDASIALLSKCEVLNFGGAPGAQDGGAGGLTRFKRGFANAAAPAYLCGKILDAETYAALSRQAGVVVDSGYFPAYRQPPLQ